MIYLGEEGGLNRSKLIFIFFIRMQEFCTLTGKDVKGRDGSTERMCVFVCVLCVRVSKLSTLLVIVQ